MSKLPSSIRSEKKFTVDSKRPFGNFIGVEIKGSYIFVCCKNFSLLIFNFYCSSILSFPSSYSVS